PPRDRQLVTGTDPESQVVEAVRQLRIRLELANVEAGARTIVVTSAVEGEGKSTTAANLAVALARVGRRIALVDLDLRRPSMHRFFGASPQPGATDVTMGSVKLDETLRRVLIREYAHDGRADEVAQGSA